jgi:hypothetical protein
VAFWYRLDAATTVCTPLLVHAGPSVTDPADNALYALLFDQNEAELYYEQQVQQPMATVVTAPPAAVMPGSWHHLVTVRDPAANTVAFYFDGGSGLMMMPAGIPDGGGAGHLRIGADMGAAGCGSFPGTMDEVYLYPRALSAAEARMLYDAP